MNYQHVRRVGGCVARKLSLTSRIVRPTTREKMAKSPDLFETSPPATKGYTAKDIEVLEGLDPVRRRPGMYIGGTDERALHHLAAEILDNAMDEAVAGQATRIEIELRPSDILCVRD